MSGNEAKTRKDIIDKRLLVAGWNVSDHTQVVEEFDIDVQVRLGVLNRKTPDKALFIRGFWFDKVASKYKTVYFQSITCSSL